MNDQPSFRLNDGRAIPAVGFGVWQIHGEECYRCVRAALAAGYRLIDTAQLYRNEEEVGRAVRDCGIARSELFVTTKIWCTDYGAEKTAAALERSLKRLGIGYIDLVLLHQPFGDYRAAWQVLEGYVRSGKVRSIGLSNFTAGPLADILARARILPVIDQIELFPYYQRAGLRTVLARHRILAEAWYPLGHGDRRLLADPALAGIAAGHQKSIAQVILRWHYQSGALAIPKAANPEHIRSNRAIFDFSLSDSEMARIDGLDRGRGSFRLPIWLQRIVFRLVDNR